MRHLQSRMRKYCKKFHKGALQQCKPRPSAARHVTSASGKKSVPRKSGQTDFLQDFCGRSARITSISAGVLSSLSEPRIVSRQLTLRHRARRRRCQHGMRPLIRSAEITALTLIRLEIMRPLKMLVFGCPAHPRSEHVSGCTDRCDRALGSRTAGDTEGRKVGFGAFT